MRRLVLLIAVVGGLAGGSLLLTRTGEPSDYRVAAIFDTARGLVPGQQVKVAGAVVGKITGVELAPGPKARVVMDVEPDVAPFHADANCKILSEGLISENYVECDPGSSRGRSLPPGEAGTPTVPVAQTSIPVTFQQMLNVYSMPANQQLRVLLSELGIATAGRGEDLNALLRRSNPALTQSRRVLKILGDQRDRVADAVGQTDRVLDELAARDKSLRAFVRRAANVSETAAARRTAVGEGIRRLPPMLRAARPNLRSLERAMVDGSPLLDNLRASAPALTTLTTRLPRFSGAAIPALRELDRALTRGRPAVRAATPIVHALKKTSIVAQPFAENFDDYMTNYRDQGGAESTVNTIYGLASYSAAYDGVSHLLTFVNGVIPRCMAGPEPRGCSHRYDSPGNGTEPVNGTYPPEASGRKRRTNAPSGAPRRAPSPLPKEAPAPPVEKTELDDVVPLLDYLLR